MAPQLFGENSDECEPGPPYYGPENQPSPDWNLKRCFCVFSISPHNEGNNKHGYNNVLVQIRSGREGWRVGGGGREGGGRLTFENPFSWRPVQKSNYSHGFFLFFFSQRDTEML